MAYVASAEAATPSSAGGCIFCDAIASGNDRRALVLRRSSQAFLILNKYPDGYNVGLNEGRTAGAGVPGHLHMHVVPRWNGDSNFMSVTGNTRVLPESLDTTYDRLLAALGS